MTDWERGLALAAESVPEVKTLFGKRILLTGATGLIGSSVAELLFFLNDTARAGIELIFAGRSRERLLRRFGKARCDHADFLPFDATRDEEIDLPCDAVIHCASNADPSAFATQPVETMLANLMGLNSLLRMAKAGKAGRILYLSSSEVYGKKEGNEPYGEEDYGYLDILHPRASYPSSKRAAETLCRAYCEEYGADVVIARPGHIYGGGITQSDQRASAQFARNAVRGENIVMKSAGSQLRSYCYELDCASALLAILIKGERANAYNVSNAASVVTIRDLAGQFARCGGASVVFTEASEAERRGYNLMQNSSLRSEKLESLGWRAKFGLQEGVALTVERLRART